MATQLRDIYNRLSADASITDEEARSLMKTLRVSYNAEAAALDYLAAVAHVCYYKPELLSEIFHYPAPALIAMGIATLEEANASYIDFLLHDPKAAIYTPLSAEARYYLENELSRNTDELNKILAYHLGRIPNGP